MCTVLTLTQMYRKCTRVIPVFKCHQARHHLGRATAEVFRGQDAAWRWLEANMVYLPEDICNRKYIVPAVYDPKIEAVTSRKRTFDLGLR